MAVGNVGDWVTTILSDPFPFEIRPGQISTIRAENTPPNVDLINPGSHTSGVPKAKAVLGEMSKR